MLSFCDKCKTIHSIPIGRWCILQTSLQSPDLPSPIDSLDTEPVDDRLNSGQPLQVITSSKAAEDLIMSEQAVKKMMVALGKASKRQPRGEKSTQLLTNPVTESESDEYFDQEPVAAEVVLTKSEKTIVATMASISSTLEGVNTRLNNNNNENFIPRTYLGPDQPRSAHNPWT